MALAADRIVMLGHFTAVLDVVRVVAGGALQRAVALKEALGHAHARGRADVLKPVVALGAGGVVEGKFEIRQRLAGAVGEVAAVIALHDVRQGEFGGLQMALQADFSLAVGIETRRIDDGGAEVGRFRAGFAGGLDVFLPGSVAALAIDAFGKRAGVNRFRAEAGMGGGDRFVTVVTEDAVVGDGPQSVGVVGGIITGGHAPVAALFGVPGDGKLKKTTVGGAVQVSAGVDRGAEEIIDFRFGHVGLSAFVAELVAALVILAAAFVHFEIGVGRGVEEVVVLGVIFDGVVGSRMGERAGHAGLQIRLINLRMAAETEAGIDVTVRRGIDKT